MKTHDFIEKKTKKRKYNNTLCQVDGIKFDSKKEATYYIGLKSEIEKGLIRDLEIHPKYPIHINNELICRVELDFSFFDTRTNKHHYIDVKAWDKDKKKFLVTDLSALKKKMVEAAYPFEVEYA